MLWRQNDNLMRRGNLFEQFVAWKKDTGCFCQKTHYESLVIVSNIHTHSRMPPMAIGVNNPLNRVLNNSNALIERLSRSQWNKAIQCRRFINFSRRHIGWWCSWNAPRDVTWAWCCRVASRRFVSSRRQIRISTTTSFGGSRSSAPTQTCSRKRFPHPFAWPERHHTVTGHSVAKQSSDKRQLHDCSEAEKMFCSRHVYRGAHSFKEQNRAQRLKRQKIHNF